VLDLRQQLVRRCVWQWTVAGSRRRWFVGADRMAARIRRRAGDDGPKAPRRDQHDTRRHPTTSVSSSHAQIDEFVLRPPDSLPDHGRDVGIVTHHPESAAGCRWAHGWRLRLQCREAGVVKRGKQASALAGPAHRTAEISGILISPQPLPALVPWNPIAA